MRNTPYLRFGARQRDVAEIPFGYMTKRSRQRLTPLDTARAVTNRELPAARDFDPN